MKKRIFTSFILICLLLAMPACAAGADQPAEDNAERLSVQSTGFTDVPADAWYAEAINYCQQNGIMSGTSATTFAPEATLTRAMLATVLHRMSGTPAVSDAPVFTDAVAGSWYSDAVSWAAKSSIISGYGGGTFGVNDPTTREQAVTILWRYAGEPERAAAADISDAASVSAWAQTAVRWANANGILEGMTNNRRFGPKTNIKRGEVASMLYHYLSNTTSSQPGPAAGGEPLVAYFSATNTTRPLAEYAADILGADLYEIVPEVPYTDADLAYYTNGRADREQSDPSARPAISGSVENMADYDVIFLGYPIWHGQPPRIISTFLESYDLTGKTIVPFCTSHSSGYSDSSIKSLAPGANWIAGRRFAGGTSRSTVEEWINGLELPKRAVPATDKTTFNFETKSVALNSGYTMPINGLGTYSLHGETCVNAIKSALASGVRLIDTASAYGNEEEVGLAIRESIDEGII